MTVLFGALAMAADSSLAPGQAAVAGSTVTTYPSSFTIPDPTLSPGTHVVPPIASSPIDIAVSALAMSGTAAMSVPPPSHTATVAATLTGTATLTEVGTATWFAHGNTWAATTTFTDQAWAQYQAAITFTPNSVLTTGPIARAFAGLAVSASGTLTVAGFEKEFVRVAMAATAALTPTAFVTVGGTVSSVWNALTTLVSAGQPLAFAGATFAVDTTLAAAGKVTVVEALTMPAAAVLVAGPVDIALSSSAWTATSTFLVNTLSVALGASLWQATTTLTEDGHTLGFLAATFGAVGEFLTDLRRIYDVDPFVMSASATFGPSILTIVKVGVAIFVGDTTLTVLEPDVYPLIPPGFVAGTGPVQPVDTTPIWRLYVADTITGRVSYQLPMASMQWQSKLNDIGTAQATLDVEESLQFLSDHDERDPRVLFRQFLSGPFRYSLCFAYGDTAVWAGPYTPGTIPGNSATVNVGASEFPYMFTKRILTGSRFHPNDAEGDVYLGPTTKADMALSMVKLATTGDPSYALPWTCSNPPPTNGGESRAYYGFDFATVWEQLSALSSEADGPDVRFDPKLTWKTDGLYLSYELRIGTPLLGALTPWAWDVPTSATVQWDTNVQNMASAYYGIGSGQDREKMNALVMDSRLTNLGFPALEMTDALHTDVIDFDQLASLTAADMTLYRTPAVKWTIGVQGSRDPTIGTFRCGDTFQVAVADHPVIADGTYRRRITGLSGSLSDWAYIESADDYVVLNTTSTGVQTIVNN